MSWYIAHSAKGTTWGKHKYVSKVFKNGKWVYKYASDAYSKNIDKNKLYEKQFKKPSTGISMIVESGRGGAGKRFTSSSSRGNVSEYEERTKTKAKSKKPTAKTMTGTKLPEQRRTKTVKKKKKTANKP